MNFRAILIAVIAVTLAGCAGPTRIQGTGKAVFPPCGWVQFCQRHPEDPACKIPPPDSCS